MKIEFDPVKNDRNISMRGLSFDTTVDFDWETAVYCEDNRRDYGETRIRAFGFIGDWLHAIVFTAIEGGVRIISLRKANQREVVNYEKNKS